MTRGPFLLALLTALALWSTPAGAHKPSDSYLSLAVVTDGVIDGRWDIALRDLEYAIGLDGNNDGAITWGELRARHAAVAAYALSRLQIRADGGACAMAPSDHLVDHHSDGAYAVLRFTVDCPDSVESFDIRYGLLFDLDPQHRGLVRVDSGGDTLTAVLSPARNTWRVELGAPNRGYQLLTYVGEGVWHIWIGFDHVLFLLTLLLPAVLRRQFGRWQPVQDFRGALVEVVRIVTAFTVAHSITLSLAALGVIALPSRLIESAIALSVVIAALNNLHPVITARLWLVAFAFGLVHGVGFANVLADLGLAKGALVLSLFGFNLGVEVGQLVIVAAFLPLAYTVRSSRLYPQVAVRLGSLAIVAVASLWFVERAFNVALPLLRCGLWSGRSTSRFRCPDC